MADRTVRIDRLLGADFGADTVLFVFFVIGTAEYLCDTAALLGAKVSTLGGFGRGITRRITLLGVLMSTFGKRNIAVLGVFVSLKINLCVFVLIFIRDMGGLRTFVLFVFFVIGAVKYLLDTAALLGAKVGTLIGFGRGVPGRVTFGSVLVGTFG